MEFTASAPCKAILFGEHYVVYGSPALSIPIEPRNRVRFSGHSGSGIAMTSALGSGKILGKGKFTGDSRLGIYAAVAREIFKSNAVPGCAAEFLPAWGMKGVGTSASLGAAFAAGLYKVSRTRASAEKIFRASQSGDLVAHEGKASGIDAKTVSVGRPMIFRKKFSPARFTFRRARFSLPPATSLFLIDTFSGKKDGTAAMLKNFARSFNIKSLPDETAADERRKVQEEFSQVWSNLRSAKTARLLGMLMDENQLLLRSRGVSGKSIGRAVDAAHASGAYGAKLTGGGGEGGAVIALCSQSGMARAMRRISDETGFSCHGVSLASRGPSTQSRR